MLYGYLLGGLALPEGSVVIFVGDKDLCSLPFGALWNFKSRRFLVESHPIGTAPSVISFLKALSSKHNSAKADGVLLIGNPKLQSNSFYRLSNLPEAEGEVQGIAGLYRNAKTEILTGGSATKKEFLHLLPQCGIIHFAGHAVANQKYPERSFLAMASSEPLDDGVLYAEEIEKLDLHNVHMVVLSACGTGLGKLSATEGELNLARPFLRAGASGVVASLWNVQDVSAKRLLVKFYENFIRGENPRNALREAQLSTMHDTNMSRASARDWAAFEIVGEPF